MEPKCTFLCFVCNVYGASRKSIISSLEVSVSCEPSGHVSNSNLNGCLNQKKYPELATIIDGLCNFSDFQPRIQFQLGSGIKLRTVWNKSYRDRDLVESVSERARLWLLLSWNCICNSAGNFPLKCWLPSWEREICCAKIICLYQFSQWFCIFCPQNDLFLVQVFPIYMWSELK